MRKHAGDLCACGHLRGMHLVVNEWCFQSGCTCWGFVLVRRVGFFRRLLCWFWI